ncbi:MAG TPA: rhomboid family intramembrane serine protease [Flavobacteriales bacterium]|nr:rhomboid family intramembrane serine protease [Flavobacteriales bacterium]MCB0808592.1 rhomboid family intramembrane serine protease [Flavobacteriales bacterium]MCB0812167.1 rhomboid family intramembrane serine protease [Flavobacteriales bacterium]MCB0816943.1 rhomboid family intramembrane serine protease [Flavobacteriales bacterium]MCB9199338.1 rhomboid family intramembrane serine protease [Flavobacteriales bacterium]
MAQAPVPVERRRLLTAALMPLLAALLLWVLFGIEQGYGLDFSSWGILPRHLSGLKGIVTSPFIHGDLEHLANNTFPILVLGWCLVYFYPKVAGRVVLATWFIAGVWVWISARPNYHIGASGVIYGLAAFLFFSGVFRKQRSLMAISLFVVFLYGGMAWGVFPILPRVSWESHLWGAIVGVILAWMYRGVAPAHVPEPIVLEDEEDEEAPPSAPPRRLHVIYHYDPGDEAPEHPRTDLASDAEPWWSDHDHT